MMSGGRSSRYPFTPSQWQELEHQALIYKYMASGIPIPSDLLLPIRRSCFFLDSTLASPSFPPQPSLRWGCFQMAFGRKAEDPEPGRCRRTDGKKWRCSKEAYPDSKYCEKHMHRGKNRSRKPVEISLANPTTTTTLPLSSSSSSSSAAAASASSTARSPYSSLSLSATTEPHHHHLLYPYSTTTRVPPCPAFPPHLSSASYPHPDPPPYYSAEKDYRYGQGMKEGEEHSFITEGAWQLTPLGMGSFGEPKEGSALALQQSSYFPCTGALSKEEEEERRRQHCFLLGADLKLEKPSTAVKQAEGQQRPLRHFFDEWPQHITAAATAATQLSISIPMSHHDFSGAAATARYSNDE